MGKKAIITVELVDESVAYSSSKITEELCRWFREESLPPPWVKEVEKVVVQEPQEPNRATWFVRK